jgi:hypothetical protein
VLLGCSERTCGSDTSSPSTDPTAAAAAAAGVEQTQEAQPWARAAAMAYDDVVDPREIRNALLEGPALASERIRRGPQLSGGNVIPMRTNRLFCLSVVLVLALSVGCASISQETIAQINEPVDCGTAEQDIAYLEDEKSGFFFRTLAIITGILPPGSFIVIGRDLFNSPDGIWTDKFKVGFGSYNEKMANKIDEARQQCGLEPPPAD